MFSSPGFPNPSVTFPSVQLPVYLWSSTRGTNKSRARLSLVGINLFCFVFSRCVWRCSLSGLLHSFVVCLQVLTAEQQRAFCRICAIVRGFLVRRLLKTEKVKNLRQTIVVRSSARKHDYSTEADKFLLINHSFELQQLYMCLQDTQEFIRSFQTEAEQKRSTYSEQDISLQERVRAQVWLQ